MNDINRGGLRLMTLGEINLARTVYGFTIRYNEVWIHRASYLPFNMQQNNVAMTPNGEMYFQEGVYEKDFSHPKDRVGGQHIFLHEMMHVWQHQHGMWVRSRGAFSWAADYYYTLDKNNLSDYSMEQQACIVSDYWLLKSYGFRGYGDLHNLRDYDESEPDLHLMARYEQVLRGFLH
ncbi:type IV secretion protein Rhs [Scandinavium goeteborgense]|uniref:type IV secretion protein Rhs n=1 Tax=Scandinavium goeteborgense TaxID=1851514 RepID=UPI001FE8EE83|nr:type IV secretion protein Rhs [Scandinavium goeteborgense]